MGSIGSSYARLALLFVTACLTPTAGAMAECEHETISTLMSPDGSWVAVVLEVICSNQAFGMTNVTDGVQLVRRGDEPKKSSESNDVFIVDRGSWEERPLTRWLSPSKLQITVPNKSLIGLQKNSYDGVDIVVKFEPDDPVERERWLKSRGLPPK